MFQRGASKETNETIDKLVEQVIESHELTSESIQVCTQQDIQEGTSEIIESVEAIELQEDTQVIPYINMGEVVENKTETIDVQHPVSYQPTPEDLEEFERLDSYIEEHKELTYHRRIVVEMFSCFYRDVKGDGWGIEPLGLRTLYDEDEYASFRNGGKPRSEFTKVDLHFAIEGYKFLVMCDIDTENVKYTLESINTIPFQDRFDKTTDPSLKLFGWFEDRLNYRILNYIEQKETFCNARDARHEEIARMAEARKAEHMKQQEAKLKEHLASQGTQSSLNLIEKLDDKVKINSQIKALIPKKENKGFKVA